MGNGEGPPPRQPRHDHAANQNMQDSSSVFSLGVQQMVRDRVTSFAAGAPLTTAHVGLSVTIHTLALMGLMPLRTVSFHPRLALAPAFQLYRVPLSVFVLGRSIPQMAYSVVSLVTWHSQLEILTSGTGDVYKDNRIVKRGTNRRNANTPKSRKTLTQWLFTENKFLRIQLATVAFAVALEMLMYSDPKDPWNAVGLSGSSTSSALSRTMDRAVLVFPYALFPVYDAALRWIWAFTELEKDTLIFGVVPVRPIYMPFVSMLMGYGKLSDVLKGLVVGTAVAATLKLRRGGVDLEELEDGDGSEPSGGELVGQFLWDFGYGWYRWIRAAGRKLLNIQAQGSSATRSGSATGSSSSSSSSAPLTFNVADAAAFMDATAIPALGPFVAEARDALVRMANGVIEIGEDSSDGRRMNSSSRSTRRTATNSTSVRTEQVVQMEDVEEHGYRLGGN